MPTKNLFEIFGEGAPPSPLAAIYNSETQKTEEKETSYDVKVVLLPADKLKPYHEHLFKPYSDEKLRELADSIKENGIRSPVLIRPYANTYEILSGHNRTAAAKLAGISEIPCIIEDYDDDDAAFVVADSNLNQRENLLPSEKARAYKIQLDFFNKRGKNVENLECFSDDNNENQELSLLGNKTTIYRFIRLTHLVPELLQAVDDDKLAIFAGAELSHIDHNEQGCIYQYFFSNNQGILDIKAAKLLRQRSAVAKLTYDEIERLFKKSKKSDVIKAYSVPTKKIQQYIPPGTSKKDAESMIIKALKYYTENCKGEIELGKT